MSFPRYPAYKDSGDEVLGVVPSHWDIRPIKTVAAVDNSGCFGSEPEDGELVLPVATTAQIDSEGRFDVEQMPPRGFAKDDIRRYGCIDGDILIVKSSGSATNIISGKAGLVDAKTETFVFSNFLMRLQANSQFVFPKFLYRIVTSHFTRERVQLMCSSTTYPNLKVGEYVSAGIPLPPLDEQAAIAAFLDRETAKIDTLVAEQERLIALLKEKRQAVISHAVTKGLNPNAPMKPSGVVWLGDVPEHWTVDSVRRLARRVDTGGTPTSMSPSDEFGDGIPWFTPGDFRGAIRIEQSVKSIPRAVVESGEAKMFPSGSVLIVSIGATLGKVALAAAECSANQQINAVIPAEKVDAYFLTYSLTAKTEVMRFLSNASTIGIMNQEKTKEVSVAVPPKHEQSLICDFLDHQVERVEALVWQAECAIELLKERRSALISAAVTGQIDVRATRPGSAIARSADA